MHHRRLPGVGVWRALLTGSPDPVQQHALEPAAVFAIDEDSIDPAVFGLTSYAAPTAPAPRLDRRSAMQVPAVKRCRDLIAGTLGTLPIDVYGPDLRPSDFSPLLTQPEKDTPRSVTMARTFEDMLFEGVAWWRITEFGWHNFPVRVRRLNARSVNVREDAKVYVARDGATQGVADEWVPDDQLIRFDSPNDPLLVAGARAIRTCLLLDAAAANHADGAPPLDYFTPADGVDPFDETEARQFLDDWRTSRQQRSTGYVPAAVKYNSGGWNAEQMQLAEARQHAVLEIARLAGVDPEEVGVSTTSRTYANQFDRRKAFIDMTLGGYISAVQDRLSMGDVNPRGHTARVNLSTFLRSDDKSRYEAYALGLRVGAITPEDIAAAEGKPTVIQPQSAPAPAADVDLAGTFDDEPAIRLDAPQDTTAFEVDVEHRTIRGLAVPYGVPAMSNGQAWQFGQGTLKYADVRRVKLWVQHDKAQAVGVATELDDRPEGLFAAFKVARGAEGDKALSLAEDGVLDGLSIGLKQGGRFRTKDGVNHAIEAPLMEVSLTPAPSYDDARVHAVAASAAGQEGNPMKCTKCGVIHADGVTECLAEDVATFEVQNGPAFSAFTDALTGAITAGFEGLQFPQREIVSAGGALEVNEPSPYRFDGAEGAQSFSEDLRSYNSDPQARQRLDTFMEEAFAVTTGNVGSLNPTQNRPDLFVPNLTFTRPLWDLVSTGVVTDKTPFTIPKFASATGLVAAHTEGVEPTPGAFTATSQTVSPSPVSGKVEIVREVWDQGGSPQADQIIWGEMLNAYFEAIEAKIATMLNGLSLTETNLASAVDEALVDGVSNIFVDLQYVRGGNRYSALALDGLLFKALINASDTSGRKLLPVVGPANAQGSVVGNFSQVQIGSQIGAAAWALGATNASHSYLFVPSSVWCWASAPKKFLFEYRVSAVDLAIWGYTGAAVLRDSDVKRLDYTTADA